MKKKYFFRRHLPKKTLFSLILASIILFVFSFVFLTFMDNDLLGSGLYYKTVGGQKYGLTSTVKQEPFRQKNIKLFAKKTITENFTADSDNLGTVAIPFDASNKSIEDIIVFRIKETTSKEWYYQHDYNANQFQTDVPFPFGFPIISDSKGKSYTFQLESIMGRLGNVVSLSEKNFSYLNIYKFSKLELISNPKVLVEFLFKKIYSQLQSITIFQVIIIIFFTLLPFGLYSIYAQNKKVILTNLKLSKTNLTKNFLSLSKITIHLKKYLSREEKIKFCSTIVVVGFFLSVSFHVFQGVFFGKGFPINSFLPNNFFGDFLGVFNQWSSHHFNSYGLNYFPGSYLIVDLLTHFFSAYTAITLYLIVFIIFIFIYTYKNVKSNDGILSFQNAFIISLMSYPFLFAFNTANFEIITFMAVALFFIFYSKNKLLSVIFLAYAISMKAFPGVFIILLLSEKRYKHALLALGFTIFFTILPLVIFDGGFNKGIENYISHFSISMRSYADLMIIDGAGNHYGHSILNGVFALFAWTFPYLQKIIPLYIGIISISTLLISSYLIFFEKVFWKKVASLVMIMNLFPIVSTDYKLLYIFIPLFFFINYPKKNKYDTIFLILFSLLLISKDYLYFNNNPYMSLNIVANPLIMLSILSLIIFSGVKPLVSYTHNRVIKLHNLKKLINYS